ncbi:MAG: M28 family peptidase [Chitinophagaceae bacterium]|nr:M28 family peptidase [Chitinophagaceae bacterium]
MLRNSLFILCFALNTIGCNDEPQSNTPVEETPKPSAMAPDFDAAKAYEHVKTQLAFGPRVPGSTAQIKCAAWLETELKKYADTVYRQEAMLTQVISKKQYRSINIIGSFNPQAKDRILLLAHWDSRPWADQDTTNKEKPIDAADDGASGVAVLLEIAAKLKQQKPTVGVDILLVDAEDVGRSEWSDQSYCLGTQHWAQNPHVAGYTARFGICLDMVGAKGAQFPLEGFSQGYAPELQRRIWDIGNRLGYSDYFRYTQGGQITDDHVVVNEMAKIPCIDIINLTPQGGFGEHWHTHQDNINIIDQATLKAVGQTVLQAIYE